MKRYLLFFVALFAGFSFAEEAVEEESRHGLYTETSFNFENEFDTGFLQQFSIYSYKLPGDWKFSLHHIAKWQLGPEFETEDTTVTHSVFRPVIGSPKLGKVGMFDFKFDFRYYLPMSESNQKKGNFGRLQFRPAFSTEFNSMLSWTWRPRVHLYFPHNGYHREDKTGNKLVEFALDTWVDVKLAEFFTLTPYLYHSFAAVMPAAGSEDWTDSLYFYHEWQFNFHVNDQLTIAPTIADETSYGDGGTFELFTKENTVYSLVAKVSWF